MNVSSKANIARLVATMGDDEEYIDSHRVFVAPRSAPSCASGAPVRGGLCTCDDCHAAGNPRDPWSIQRAAARKSRGHRDAAPAETGAALGLTGPAPGDNFASGMRGVR